MGYVVCTTIFVLLFVRLYADCTRTFYLAQYSTFKHTLQQSPSCIFNRRSIQLILCIKVTHTLYYFFLLIIIVHNHVLSGVFMYSYQYQYVVVPPIIFCCLCRNGFFGRGGGNFFSFFFTGAPFLANNCINDLRARLAFLKVFFNCFTCVACYFLKSIGHKSSGCRHFYSGKSILFNRFPAH